MPKFHDTAAYVVSIIKVWDPFADESPSFADDPLCRQRDYAPDYASIPPHGRWQHFDVGGRPRIDQLLASWPSTIDKQERTRRLIDLFLVSVLLDAGAGANWAYKSKESGKTYRRSEGLAVASLEMFKAGAFSSDATQPCQVDATGLTGLTLEQLSKGLQVTDSNTITGLDGRLGLLTRLAEALINQELFGVDARPGNMLGQDLRGLLPHLTAFSRLTLVQITFSPTLQLKPLPSRSSRSPPSGQSSWTVSHASGQRVALRSTASLSATPGRVRRSHLLRPLRPGKRSSRSTN